MQFSYNLFQATIFGFRLYDRERDLLTAVMELIVAEKPLFPMLSTSIPVPIFFPGTTNVTDVRLRQLQSLNAGI